MEHESSFNKQLRKEITARAKMNKKIKLLEGDMFENILKKYMMQIKKLTESKRLCVGGNRKIVKTRTVFKT